MRNIWLCPICGSTSKRQGNIRRHAKTKHEQNVVPTAYDPLSRRVSGTHTQVERFTTLVQQDLMPYFFPFNNQHSHKNDPVSTLTHNLNKMADFADTLQRLKQHNLFSGVPAQTFSNMANFGFQNLAAMNIATLNEPPKRFITFYLCPKCRKGITMPWQGLTAKAAHEEAGPCQSNLLVPSAQALELIKKDAIKNLIHFTESAFPVTPRYVISLPFDEITRYPFFEKVFSIVQLGPISENHWAMRACRNGKTEINGQELEEFITKASGNLAIFKAQLNSHEGYYFMQISDTKTMATASSSTPV